MRRWKTSTVQVPGILLAIVLTSGAGCSDAKSPVDIWNTPAINTRLSNAFQEWIDDFGLYGGAMRVYSPGRVDRSYASGLEHVRDNVPYGIDTLGRVGSVTKTFTATIVMQLIDEGLLTMDRTLDEFLQDMPDFPYAGEITVEHLLRHQSGIVDIQTKDLLFLLYVVLHPYHWITPQEILEWTYGMIPILSVDSMEFMPREPVGAPGEQFHYSQPGYCALGMIIEQLTGRTLADVYDERIIEPLGLNNTRMPREDDPVYPPGYSNLFGRLDAKISTEPFLPSGNAFASASWTAGGLTAAAGDLVTFLHALLGGELCSEGSLAMLQDWNPYYGLGMFREERGGYAVIGHDGSVPGGQGVNYYIPELDVYIGAVTNSDNDPAPGAPDIAHRVWTVLSNAT